jgi:hypothetical protein
MARVYRILRQENENCVQLKQLTPNHKLPFGLLREGKDAIKKGEFLSQAECMWCVCVWVYCCSSMCCCVCDHCNSLAFELNFFCSVLFSFLHSFFHLTPSRLFPSQPHSFTHRFTLLLISILTPTPTPTLSLHTLSPYPYPYPIPIPSPPSQC